MYCQHCGAEATQDLNYCKRCGGNLNLLPSVAGQQMTRPGVSMLTVAAIGLTTFGMVVGGLLVLFGMLYNISSHPDGVRGDALIWLGGFGALTILGSVALLMRLWMMLLANKAPQETTGSLPFQLIQRASTKGLGAPRISALPGAMPASVTEHTTRTFEPSYREKS
jgi:hypothetical protein